MTARTSRSPRAEPETCCDESESQGVDGTVSRAIEGDRMQCGEAHCDGGQPNDKADRKDLTADETERSDKGNMLPRCNGVRKNIIAMVLICWIGGGTYFSPIDQTGVSAGGMARIFTGENRRYWRSSYSYQG